MTQHNDEPESALGIAFREGSENGQSRPSILEVDLGIFIHHLENSGLSAVQKEEVLSALWSIMLNFVDLGFGIHPVQQIPEEDIENIIESSGGNADTIGNSTHNNMTQQFSETAKGDRHEP